MKPHSGGVFRLNSDRFEEPQWGLKRPYFLASASSFSLFEEPQWGLKLYSRDDFRPNYEFEEPQWGLKLPIARNAGEEFLIRRTPMGIETKN